MKKFSVELYYDNSSACKSLRPVKNGKEYFVQVAYSIAENSTYEREFAPFNMTDNSRKKIIIINDEIDYSTSTVQHIKLKDFLFMEDLENSV